MKLASNGKADKEQYSGYINLLKLWVLTHDQSQEDMCDMHCV